MKYLPLMVILMGIMMVGMVSATLTVVSPAAGSYQKSTFLANCTYENTTDIESPTAPGSGNTSFFWNGTGTWQLFTTLTGPTCSINACWATLRADDTGILDGVGSIRCSLGNSTVKWYANATSGALTLDDTKPVITVELDTIGAGTTLLYKCTDNVDGTPTLTITHPTGDSISSGTLTGGSSSLLPYSSTVYPGTYTITCTDDTANSATKSITVLGGNAAKVTQSQGLSSQTLIGIIIIIALIIYFTNKK
jgi:hypothetical protein